MTTFRRTVISKTIYLRNAKTARLTEPSYRPREP